MKRILLLLYTAGFLAAWASTSQAQVLTNKGGSIHIGSGGTLAMRGGFQNLPSGEIAASVRNDGSLQLTGDWQTEDTAQYTGTGTFILNGDGAQTFSATNFHNLRLAGQGVKTAVGQSTIRQSLEFAPGATAQLHAADSQTPLRLFPTATLTETDSSYVLGGISTTHSINHNETFSFGGISIFAAGVAPGQTTIVRLTGPSTVQTIGGIQSIARLYQINPDNNSALDAQITFTYFSHEADRIEDAPLHLYASSDEGRNWEVIGGEKEGALSAAGISSLSWVTAAPLSAPLPVTWLSFEGKSILTGNQLTWATASESNTSHFLVERSVDTKDFETIATIPASGHSAAPLTYTYLDNSPKIFTNVTIYYRLQQVDLDHGFEYSRIIGVAVSRKQTAVTIKVSPNPFDRRISIQLNHPAPAGPAEVSFHTLEGKEVYHLRLLQWPTNGQLDLLDLPHLPQAMYLLKVKQSGQDNYVRVLKQ